MIYFGGLFGEAIANVEITLNTGIYTFVNWLYQVYLYIASARLIKNDAIDAMKKRLMVLVGIVMLFIVAFSLLKAIIDPDKEIKNTSKIFTTVVTSLIMLTLVNTIFNYLYEAQTIILKENLIGKIILGGVDTSDKDIDLSSAGINMAANTLNAFFNDATGEEDNDKKYISENHWFGSNDEITRTEIIESAMENESMGAFSMLAHAIDEGEIDFSWILALICGGFMVYIFISFCLDMAVRSIKLALLQIIAPIPILARIIPGQENIFNNWIKKTSTAFLEVFIKLAIIFFGIYLITILGNNINGLTVNNDIIGEVSETVKTAGYVAVVIGILMFIKQAPGYISEIFGVNSGNMKLGLKDKLSGMVGAGIVGGAVGATTGAIGAGWSSAINGGSIAKGIKYGAAGGWKNKWGQFNSQRQGLYNSMGFKGKAALLGHFEGKKFKLGGQSTSDKAFDDIKNSYVDDYKDNVIPKKIKEIENSEKFGKLRNQAESRWFAERDEMQTKHNSNIASIEAAREQARNEYYTPEAIAARKQQAYDNINKQRAALLSQKSAKMAEFAKYREDQMAALRSRVGKDPTATQEYNRFKNMKFEDSYIGKDYNNQLNKLANAKFVDVKFESSSQNKAFENQINEANAKFEAKMAEYNDKENRENTIKEWAQADMMDADETYKNYVKIQKARENEKSINSWANSIEGQKSIYAAQQGYKSAQKNPADGQKPPGGPNKK